MAVEPSDYFPTEFAKAVARKVRLYNKKHPSEYESDKRNEWERMENLLGEFQQIAVLHGSEVAMNVYFNEKLSTRQKEALKVIGDFSRVQVSGEAVKSMMEIIEKNKSHKDYSKVVETMMETVKDEFSDQDEIESMIEKLLK